MNEESSSAPDLSSLGMDLAQSFAPSWAREGDSKERREKLAERHGGGEDPGDRGRGGKGRDRSPRDRAPRDRADRGDRGPGGKRDGRGGGGRRDERRPERAPQKVEPTVTGWNVKFLPDRHGVEGLAKQIKSSAKAYPLFDLARLVLEKSERYVVEFRRAGEDASKIWQTKVDGTLWLSESDAIGRALAAGLDKYYRRERVTVDPPKGAFPFVAVCGMSGTLLGPPNFHDYQTKVMALYQERFSNMGFEAFKSRIKMERDEALIEKWREEQSGRDVFFVRTAEKPEAAAVETPTAAEEPEPVAAEESVAAVVFEDAGAAEPVVEQPADEPSVELVEPASDEVVATDAPVGEVVEMETPDAPAPTETAPERDATGERLETMADVERHFREHHAAKEVKAIRDRVVVPGPAALNDSAPAVLGLTRGLWEELNRFPLPLAHGLGQQLTGKGLQIFKTPDKVTHVGVARPHFLDIAATPISDALSAMLTYLAEHENQPRAEQWAGLVALRSEAEADRETAMVRDLSWLLHEGHVLDYARKGLVVARRPKARPPTDPKIAPGEGEMPRAAATSEGGEEFAVVEETGTDFIADGVPDGAEVTEEIEPPAVVAEPITVEEPVASTVAEPEPVAEENSEPTPDPEVAVESAIEPKPDRE